MGRFRERMRSLRHWPSRKRPSTPSERKQEARWEGEGGALHPADADADDRTPPGDHEDDSGGDRG